MLKDNVKKYYSVDYKFEKTEDFIKEFEEFGRKFFEDNTLKLGFRIFDGVERVTLNDYLSDNSNAYGEFSLYFIKDTSVDTMNTKISHETHKDKIFIGNFCLDQMKGCCGICIMFHMMVDFDLQGKKFGHHLIKLQKILAKEKDFTQLICTDRITNTPQRVILNKFGFKPCMMFQNSKTKNYVELRGTDLNDEKYYDVIWKKESLISRRLKPIKKLLKRIYSIATIKQYYLNDTLVNQSVSKKVI